MTEPAPPHQRRVRYSGTHPREFADKYKELDPTQHADAIAKVLQRGQTPAGMHRSICVNEIMALLKPQPNDIGLDATLGWGGHSRELLARLTGHGQLLAIDVDPIELPRTEARLRALGYDESKLRVQRVNFSHIARLQMQAPAPAEPTEVGSDPPADSPLDSEHLPAPTHPAQFDFVLADLGVSSMQIDNPARGFSFKLGGPLDLRLNPQAGQSACELLLSITRPRLREVLADNADEPHAAPLADALQGQFIETTTALAERVRATLATVLNPRMPLAERELEVKKALQRVFQALRIEVNNEFGVLDKFLADLPATLKPGARVAILSFHSGEDRRVKKAFQGGERSGIYQSVAADFIRPSFDEQRANPRASSAKLRWAVRSDAPIHSGTF